MPDVAQHQEGESDYKPEETYVDAFNLDLRHDVTDIFVPVGSEQFSLEVRRSLGQDSWALYGGLAPTDHPGKPFGPCWSSGICPNLQVVMGTSDSVPSENTHSYSIPGSDTKIVATDFNGQSYTFRYYVNTSTNLVAWMEPSSSQNALSCANTDLNKNEEGIWVLSLPNGTKCYYSSNIIDTAQERWDTSDTSYSATLYEFHRIERVVDRAGNELQYGFSSSVPNSLIPSAITSTQTEQALDIHTDNAGMRVEWVEDALGNRIDYHYASGCLESVEREDGGSTSYSYTNSIYSPGYTTYKQMMVDGFEDANSNRYEVVFTHVLCGDDFSGSRFRMAELKRPGDNGSVYFSDNGTMAMNPGVSAHSNTVIDVNGNTWSYCFSDPYRTDPMSYSVAPVVVDEEGEASSSDSHTSLYEYRQLMITAPGGGTETYRFEPLGLVTTNRLKPLAIVAQTNFSGQATSFAYGYTNSSCYKPSVQYDALNNPKYFSYTDSYGNQIASETDALGRTTAYGFDDLGNRTSVTNFASGGSTILGITDMVYGDSVFTNFLTMQIVHRMDASEPAWITDMVTEFVPDQYGKVAQKIVDPDGLALTTTYDYDLNNNLIYVMDPNGNVTTNGYDALNRLVLIAFFEGSNTNVAPQCTKQFWYDKRSNKTWEKDENDHYTFYQYNEFNNLTNTVRVMDVAFTGPSDGLDTYDYGTHTDAIVSSSEYNPDGTLASSTDARGLVTTNLYDSLRRLETTIVDPDGLAYTNSFEYSTTENYCGGITLPPYKFMPTSVTDPRGYTTETVYDALNRPVETKANVSNKVDLVVLSKNEYDDVGNLVTVSNKVDSSHWQVTETRYDGLNHQYMVINPDTTHVGIRYTSTGLQWQTTNELGRVSTVEYDAAGRPVKTISPPVPVKGSYYSVRVVVVLKNTGTTVYDETTIYPGEHIAETTYQEYPDVYVNTVFTPLEYSDQAAVTVTEYDANGNVWKVTDPVAYAAAGGGTVPESAKTVNSYDYRNRLTETSAPEVPDWGPGGSGALTHPVVSTLYDKVGNATNITDAVGNTTDNFYDAANRLVVTWAPPVPVYGKTGLFRPATTNEYDKGGNIRFTHDANGKTVQMQYDAIGRLTNTIDAVANTISFEYDANGNQTALVDGEGHRTVFVYDGFNRKTHTYYPSDNDADVYNNDHETADYDLVGNRTQRTDCNGAITKYKYDDRNRLDLVSYMASNGTSTNRTRDYAYDAAGNLTNVVESADSNACVSYTYDALNRVSSETSVGVTHTYHYDLNGNRLAAEYGVSGRQVVWTYDTLNRITKINENGNDTTYRYDLNGKPVYRQYPSNAKELRSYDAMGRMLTMTTTNLASDAWFKMDYQYDAVGSARRMDQTSSSGLDGKAADATTYWQYDARYRLTNEIINVVGGTNYVTSYEWDTADNRQSKIALEIYNGTSTTVESISYTNNTLNQITGWHDSVANKDVVYHYYDNGNRAHKLDGGVNTYYFYDEDNRLTTAVCSSGTPVVNEFKYDYRSRRYYRATSTETNICIFDGGLSVQEYDVSANSQLQTSNLDVEYLRGPDLGGGVGGMVYSIRNNQRIFSHANHRGDVIARSNASRSLTWFALYEAYGRRSYEWSDGATGNPDRQKANTKDEEAEIGLLNEGMRFRDLETGTFLTRDPIGYADGPNIYCYVHCNPITSFDPLGLEDYIFNPKGKFIGIKGEVGDGTPQGYIMGSDGNDGHYFAFADPEADAKVIQSGQIKRVVQTTDKQVQTLMRWSGAADHKTDGSVLSTTATMLYFKEEGQKDLDFATAYLPDAYPGSSSTPVEAEKAALEGHEKPLIGDPAKNLFLEPGGEMAHNQLNFGNWLIGAAAATAGLSEKTILLGAHWNSLANSEGNGYESMPDTPDDQLSISRGYNYAKSQDYYNNLQPTPPEEQ